MGKDETKWDHPLEQAWKEITENELCRDIYELVYKNHKAGTGLSKYSVIKELRTDEEENFDIHEKSPAKGLYSDIPDEKIRKYIELMIECRILGEKDVDIPGYGKCHSLYPYNNTEWVMERTEKEDILEVLEKDTITDDEAFELIGIIGANCSVRLSDKTLSKITQSISCCGFIRKSKKYVVQILSQYNTVLPSFKEGSFEQKVVDEIKARRLEFEKDKKLGYVMIPERYMYLLSDAVGYYIDQLVLSQEKKKDAERLLNMLQQAGGENSVE